LQNESLSPTHGPDAPARNVEPTASLIIGPYRLLNCLGQGGMGEVWLADQTNPVRRRVAVKLIKAGMNTREVVARFASERQALAVMDHPAIAKVFDAGATAEGLPYFVMEYVAAVPITHYCDQHCLTIRERLELFVQVCSGVQHAHQKAMIHRDLKPSNILTTQIDGKPVPKIIDFGIAKATSPSLTEETMFTQVGALIGTPEYMSPEQAHLGEDVDTRTDVYSLGVVFYELLVGALPLELTTNRNLAFHELLRRIREEDAPRPSTKLRTSVQHAPLAAGNRRIKPDALRKQLKGDLDSIALKALEKDRSRRYGSPGEFAADIERYLHGEPVLAVAPSVAYHARKFIRRHRIIVTASVAVAMVACALIASLTISSARIARERDRANREAQAAERVADFLVGTFKVSDPNESRGNKITAREILDKGARQIDTDLARQPYLQARLMATMATVYEGLGLYQPARQLVEKAIPLQRRVLGPDNRETLAAQRLLAKLLENQAHFPESEKLYQEIIQKQERAFGPDDIETLRTKNNLGILLSKQGRYADAERLLTDVVKTTDRVAGRDSPESLNALSSLAVAYDGSRQYQKEASLDEELYRRRLQKLGADHPDTLASMQNLAYTWYRQGRYAEAEVLQRRGLETARRVYGNDHPNVQLILGNLANTLLSEGKPREAEVLQREALEGRLRVLGPNHQETQFAIANLGIILAAQKRYAEAERLYREALEGEIRILGEHHPEIAYAWYNLAGVEAVQGKRASALADLHRAIDHGYSDADEISQDEAWTALRKDPAYQAAVARMKKQQPSEKAG
jgi:non-specific serine/threonine protein kinase/serine/threonine-protein kinase